MDRKYFLIKLRIGISCLPIFLLFLSGCGTMITPKEVNLSLSGRYQDVIKLIEDREANGQNISQRERYTLCEAYLQSSIYKKLFPCADTLERQMEAESGSAYVIGVGSLAAKPWIMRARANLELENLNQAVSDAEKAYSIDPRGDSDRFTALALLAYAQEKMGNPRKAALYLDKLDKESIVFMGWGIQVLEKRKAKAFAQFSLKRYQEFLAEGEDHLAGFMIGLADVTGDTHQTYSVEFPVRFARAKALYETGRPEEALVIYKDLLTHPQINQWGSIYWQILFDMGKHSISLGKNEEGINTLEKAVSSIEEKRSTIDIEAGRIGFVGDKQAVYRHLIAALFNNKKYSTALEYIERSKSRALVDMLATKKDFAIQTGNEQQVRELIAMTDKNEQETLAQDTSSKKDNTRSLVIRAREQLQRQSSELASLVSVTSLSVKEIQKLIPADETLIEYYYTDKDIYVFVLTSHGLSAIRLDSGNLPDEIKNFRQSLENVSLSSYETPSRQLFNKLLKPIENSLSTRKLIIVPHGALHYLPFYALNDGRGYIIERYSIRMLPSAGVIKYLQKQKAAKPGDILAFGNPDLGNPQNDLSYAQNEAIAVSRTLPRSKVFLRKEATEGALRKFGGGFSYIHFATHGEFDADRPLNSALLLAADSESDGRLTVDKLYSMKLNADLVTLSACETGLGKIANGDDVVGLTRGFLYAGSSSIVASLWKVDDLATSTLMTSFYVALKKTDKREALRKAQLQNKKKYPHPYYWASFQLTGNAQ